MNPRNDATDVVEIWTSLGLPGIVYVHTHFMPKHVLDKVWADFDTAGSLAGRTWHVAYRADEAERVDTLRRLRGKNLFGSDFPNIPYSYAAELRSVTELPGVDQGWLRAVLYHNAAQAFSL
jgi:hypothetical protein